jgi:MtN3 and saliva related transmembrane protein
MPDKSPQPPTMEPHHTARVDITAAIGFIAGILTTGGNVPQVIKCYRTHSAEGLSFRMLLTLAAGLGLWTIYGAMTSSLPIILANGVGLALFLALIVMKFRFDSRPTKD